MVGVFRFLLKILINSVDIWFFLSCHVKSQMMKSGLRLSEQGQGSSYLCNVCIILSNVVK